MKWQIDGDSLVKESVMASQSQGLEPWLHDVIHHTLCWDFFVFSCMEAFIPSFMEVNLLLNSLWKIVAQSEVCRLIRCEGLLLNSLLCRPRMCVSAISCSSQRVDLLKGVSYAHEVMICRISYGWIVVSDLYFQLVWNVSDYKYKLVLVMHLMYHTIKKY